MDNSGIMTPSQLILALRRLRGSARHGEIVKVDLMVRALQIKIDAVWAWTQAASGQDTASDAAFDDSFFFPLNTRSLDLIFAAGTFLSPFGTQAGVSSNACHCD